MKQQHIFTKCCTLPRGVLQYVAEQFEERYG